MANIYYKLNDYIPLTSIYDLKTKYTYYTYDSNTYTLRTDRIAIYHKDDEEGLYTTVYWDLSDGKLYGTQTSTAPMWGWGVTDYSLEEALLSPGSGYHDYRIGKKNIYIYKNYAELTYSDIGAAPLWHRHPATSLEGIAKPSQGGTGVDLSSLYDDTHKDVLLYDYNETTNALKAKVIASNMMSNGNNAIPYYNLETSNISVGRTPPSYIGGSLGFPEGKNQNYQFSTDQAAIDYYRANQFWNYFQPGSTLTIGEAIWQGSCISVNYNIAFFYLYCAQDFSYYKDNPTGISISGTGYVTSLGSNIVGNKSLVASTTASTSQISYQMSNAENGYLCMRVFFTAPSTNISYQCPMIMTIANCEIVGN